MASALVLTIHFGALYHGLPTSCERFAARVTTGLTHHSVPAGDRPWPGRARYLQGSKQGFEVNVELRHLFLLVRAWPGARVFGHYAFEAQRREAMVGCSALNRMYELGKPESYPVAG